MYVVFKAIFYLGHERGRKINVKRRVFGDDNSTITLTNGDHYCFLGNIVYDLEKI